MRLKGRIERQKEDWLLLLKRVYCTEDQTYLKSSARCVNVKKVNKQLPADGPALTDGMLCPNCYQRRIERWVGGL
jgi:hypothetical protein